MTIRKIVLIGAGNVATHLGLAFLNKGLKIEQVFSRTALSANSLASKLHAVPVVRIEEIIMGADLYIISVSDDAIGEIANKINFNDGLVVHTSGTVPMDILKQCTGVCGVFYPLQTFSKDREIDFHDVPVLIEASDPQMKKALSDLGNLISAKVQVCDSEKRKFIHLAAVFACNFSNFMYTLSDEILNTQQLSFDLLRPLILETALKAMHQNPLEVQTGPAIRNDQSVIDAHLKLLAGDPEKQEIYKTLSKQISKLVNKD
jgi:predicted short-subunit dehydrogenase-like oxidoreductase (DUF2520 family)